MRDNPTIERLTMALAPQGAAAVVRKIFVLTTDDELVSYWLLSDGAEGNPVGDLLAFEMERREIAF